ncbi:hypothetical protein EYF80_030631 [Liparis tanakae]|uniref:Uncharacterized protein n=1 Tax=Liparis tanakae TaxID=230148 RepID=A0A4Z2H0Q9_9TELE|nr:hypothetical protein EYF80_030631 [Liparis tanakae]
MAGKEKSEKERGERDGDDYFTMEEKEERGGEKESGQKHNLLGVFFCVCVSGASRQDHRSAANVANGSMRAAGGTPEQCGEFPPCSHLRSPPLTHSRGNPPSLCMHPLISLSAGLQEENEAAGEEHDNRLTK